MFQVLPFLLLFLQLLLSVGSWFRPNKPFLIVGSALVGFGCLYLTGFVVQVSWYLSLKTLLYFSVGVVQVFYVLFALLSRQALWRIAPLAHPLLLVFLVFAVFSPYFMADQGFLVVLKSLQWHVVGATAAYGIFTFAAFFAFAIMVRQAYLKAQKRSGFVSKLPSLEVLEGAQSSALWVSLGALIFAICAGSVYTHQTTGSWFLLEAKSVLSFITVFLILALLAGKRVCGVRGRQGAQMVLVAYFFLIILFSLSLSF